MGVFTHLGASICPHMFVCPMYIWTPHMFKHPHMLPVLPCVFICSRGYLHVIWGCRGPSMFEHPTCFDTSHYVKHSLHICMLPCTSLCSRGYLHVIWEIHPICWESLGHQHICQAFCVCQYIIWMSIMLYLVPIL